MRDGISPERMKSAQAGDSEAMYRVGLQLYYEDEMAESARWLRRAALLDHPEAACLFGYFCEKGLGLSPDPQLALEFYGQAEELPYAAYRLGVHCEAAAESPRDYRQAVEHYMQYLHAVSAMQEDPLGAGAVIGEVYLRLGRCLREIAPADRPYFAPPVLQCFESAGECAEDRELLGEALYWQGYVHLFGPQTDPDWKLAEDCLTEAVGCGHAEAAALREEMRLWERIPEGISGPADADAQKTEALLRLGILCRKGLNPAVCRAFAESGIPGYAADDTAGAVPFCAGEHPEIRQAIENWERRGALVYFVHVSLSLDGGWRVSLFFVSENSAQWPADRRSLLLERTVVAVDSLRGSAAETGRIVFGITSGGMERLN